MATLKYFYLDDILLAIIHATAIKIYIYFLLWTKACFCQHNSDNNTSSSLSYHLGQCSCSLVRTRVRCISLTITCTLSGHGFSAECFSLRIDLIVKKWLCVKQIDVTKVITKPGVLIIGMRMEMNHLVQPSSNQSYAFWTCHILYTATEGDCIDYRGLNYADCYKNWGWF